MNNLEKIGKAKIIEIVTELIENEMYYELYLFFQPLDLDWFGGFNKNLKEYLISKGFEEANDEDNVNKLKFSDDTEEKYNSNLEHRYIDLTKEEKLEVIMKYIDEEDWYFLRDFTFKLYRLDNWTINDLWDNPFNCEVVDKLIKNKMKNYAFKLINLPYQFKCWKCKKIMEINNEIDFVGNKKPCLVCNHYLTTGIGKDYYLPLHKCALDDADIGCCTCDGSVHKFFASCAEHSNEIISVFHEYRNNSPEKAKGYTSHKFLRENIEDCAIKP
jgi:hypothetical protein